MRNPIISKPKNNSRPTTSTKTTVFVWLSGFPTVTVRQSKISTLAFKLYAIRAEASALCQLLEAITNAYYGILFTALAVLATVTLAEVTGKFDVASFCMQPNTDQHGRTQNVRNHQSWQFQVKEEGQKTLGKTGLMGRELGMWSATHSRAQSFDTELSKTLSRRETIPAGLPRWTRTRGPGRL
ncbi:hypothetical protein E4U22_007159 [Claviceps purpurea]|nr:hypothetical protein E4U22_007159 [Claviceps purpurea]